MSIGVLVTGVAGFIGFHLAKRLVGEGCQVYGILRHRGGIVRVMARPLARTQAYLSGTSARLISAGRTGLASSSDPQDAVYDNKQRVQFQVPLSF